MQVNEKEISYSLEELSECVTYFLKQLSKPTIVCFYAEMGIGKTTFILEMLRQMGIEQPKGSPTYSLVNEYVTDAFGKVMHLDLYRIKDEEELYDIGFEDIVYENQYVFIEWPERAENILPEERIDVKIEIQEDGRRKMSWR